MAFEGRNVFCAQAWCLATWPHFRFLWTWHDFVATLKNVVGNNRASFSACLIAGVIGRNFQDRRPEARLNNLRDRDQEGPAWHDVNSKPNLRFVWMAHRAPPASFTFSR